MAAAVGVVALGQVKAVLLVLAVLVVAVLVAILLQEQRALPIQEVAGAVAQVKALALTVVMVGLELL
jgi:hypothetical protein